MLAKHPFASHCASPWSALTQICEPFSTKPRRGGGGVEQGGDAPPCVSADSEAVAAQPRCRDG